MNKLLLGISAAFILYFNMTSEVFADPKIQNVSQSAQTVKKYEKFEVTLDVTDSVATNRFYPYDNQTVSGLVTRNGITVDGLFLPPGESDWSKANVIPGFYFQNTLIDSSVGPEKFEWIYPVGKPHWVIRYAAKEKGEWRYKIRVQDASNYPNWKESWVRTFNVTDNLNSNGFVEIAKNDTRYFEFDSGTTFVGIGHETSFTSTENAAKKFALYDKSNATFFRMWLGNKLLFSRGTHGWDAWKRADSKRSDEESFNDHDFSIKLSGRGDYIFQSADDNQFITGGLEAGKTYGLQLRVKKSSDFKQEDLVVKLIKDPGKFLDPANTVVTLGPNPKWTIKDWGNGWINLQGTFTNTQGRIIFNWGHALAVGLNNDSTVYIDRVHIGELDANGDVGPNVVFKGWLDYHRYVDQLAAAQMDRVIEMAEDSGIYLKLVVSDKEDRILTRIRSDGKYDDSLSVNGGSGWDRFHSEEGRKSRKLQEYYWRYLAARWGYSQAIHSWELLNEGDPNRQSHYNHAAHFAKAMHTFDPNHLATTSFWSGLPYNNFWSVINYSELDYVDVHAYVSTGWLKNPLYEGDAAGYHIDYSRDIRFKLDSVNVEKPVVRGEAGLDSLTRQVELENLKKDTAGVWLHNFLWSQLDSSGMYELYWWTDNIRKQPGPDGDTENGLYEIYAYFYDFMNNISVANGKYIDINPQVSDLKTRVVGQKEKDGSSAFLWIQNKEHTVSSVVGGKNISRLTSRVTIDNLKPYNTFPVEVLLFTTSGNMEKKLYTFTTTGSGRLTLDLSRLPENVTDVAFKIGRF